MYFMYFRLSPQPSKGVDRTLPILQMWKRRLGEEVERCLRSHSRMVRQDLNTGLSGPGCTPTLSPNMGSLDPGQPTAPLPSLKANFYLDQWDFYPLLPTCFSSWCLPSAPGFHQGLLSSRPGAGGLPILAGKPADTPAAGSLPFRLPCTGSCCTHSLLALATVPPAPLHSRIPKALPGPQIRGLTATHHAADTRDKTSCFLCEHLIWNLSLPSHSSPVTWVIPLGPFYRGGN